MKITKKVDMRIRTKYYDLCNITCRFLSFYGGKPFCDLYVDNYDNPTVLEKNIRYDLPFRCKKCIEDFGYGETYE